MQIKEKSKHEESFFSLKWDCEVSLKKWLKFEKEPSECESLALVRCLFYAYNCKQACSLWFQILVTHRGI